MKTVVHICATYHAKPGEVFVDDTVDTWRRVRRGDAKRSKIIRCSIEGCKGAAVTLGHFYPYYINENLRRKHCRKEST